MVLIVFGLFAVIVTALLGLPDGRRRRRRAAASPAATGRLQTLRLLVRPHEPVHVLVRHDRRLLPVLLVLRDRSEPGAALSHDAVGGRGAALAADERLLEDSAAGAGARPRRAGVRVLRVHAAAAALQLACDESRMRDGPAAPTIRRAASVSSTTRSSGARAAATELACARGAEDGTPRGGRAKRRSRARGGGRRDDPAAGDDAGARDDRRCGVHRRELHHSRRSSSRELPIGLVGLLIVAILARGYRHDCRRAELALDGHGHRLLPPVGPAGGYRRALPDACRRSRPVSGGCSPASWRSGRPSSDR